VIREGWGDPETVVERLGHYLESTSADAKPAQSDALTFGHPYDWVLFADDGSLGQLARDVW
jgi:hypothetical protein